MGAPWRQSKKVIAAASKKEEPKEEGETHPSSKGSTSQSRPSSEQMWSNAPPRHRYWGGGRSSRPMKIWNAGTCNIAGCTRYRSYLWHGEKLVGHHAHCCCMCRMSNGKDHAYYCKADGHVYLKDDGTKYSTIFVKDNGREAAEAECVRTSDSRPS